MKIQLRYYLHCFCFILFLALQVNSEIHPITPKGVLSTEEIANFNKKKDFFWPITPMQGAANLISINRFFICTKMPSLKPFLLANISISMAAKTA